jgi:hypothetical protein
MVTVEKRRKDENDNENEHEDDWERRTRLNAER